MHNLCGFLFLGYCFLLFQDELSVQTLIDSCVNEDSKLFWFVSSPTMKDKMVSACVIDLLVFPILVLFYFGPALTISR